MLRKIWQVLLLGYLFLLPWQTRWIYEPKFLNGAFWEYGSASFFATEVLLWLVILLYFFDQFRNSKLPNLFGKIHWQTHKNNLFLSLGLVVFLVFGVFHSRNILLSYEYFFHLITALCLFVILGNLENKKWFLTAAWSGGVLQGALALWQFISQEAFANKWLGMAYHAPDQLGSFVVESGGERWLRAYGSFGSPNILGGYLAVMLVLGLILYLQSRPAEKIYLTFGQAFVFIGLVLSFSRGAYLGAAVGFAIIGVSVLRTSKDQNAPWYSRFHPIGMYIKQCIFYILILAALVPILTPTLPVRISATSRLERRSISERTSQYVEASALSQKNIWFGVGPGAYTSALAEMKPGLPAYSYQPVHNSFYLLFVEWGSFGAVLWLALFGALLAFVHKRHPEMVPLIFVMIVSAAFDHFWWSLPGGLSLWWAVFGLAL
jgi:hypothetical protein